MSENLVVIGQGYVGLPMALRAAAKGLSVTGFDTNLGVVDNLNAGVSHIDDVTADDLRSALAGGFRASSDPATIANANYVVVCVPTPLSSDGGPDLRPVEAAARTIGEHVQPGALVVLESTTYPGTTEEVFAPLVLRDGMVAGKDIHIAFSPERIDPGNQNFGISNTPKVVGGLTPECTAAARRFYEKFVDTVVEAKGAKEAEMAKLLENTFRHVNIALVNEMVRFSHELDIDLWDAIDCAATKPFGFMAFRPGPGVGGHCIPVDPSYLSHRVKAQLGYAFRMVELAEEINTAAPLYVAQRVWQALNDRKVAVNGSRVLLLGVTYKANISDRRESPADPVARRLLEWGAEVSYHDPHVSEWTIMGTGGVTLTGESDLIAATEYADIVVLLQAHAEYTGAELGNAEIVLDTRAALPRCDRLVRL